MIKVTDKKLPDFLGFYPICNSITLLVLSIDYDITDSLKCVLVNDSWDEIVRRTTHKIRYDKEGSPFFIKYGTKYLFSEILRRGF